MRFVLIRHAQSRNNALWQRTGSATGRESDPMLTDLGERQAQLLAAAAGDGVLPWAVDTIHCSLMSRAVQTAAPLADALDLPLHAHPEIFEVGGPYEDGPGETPVAVRGAGRNALAQLSSRLVLSDDVTEEGWYAGDYEAERSLSLARAHRVIDDLRRRCAADTTLALVTHGFFTQMLLRAMLGIEEMTGWFQIDNTAISLLEDAPDPWTGSVRLLRLNWTPHLTADQISE